MKLDWEPNAVIRPFLRRARRWRIVSVVGTRPEAIKMAPLVRALAARRSLDQQLLLTGQHPGLSTMFAGVAPDAICELGFDPRGLTPSRLRESLHALLCRRFAPDRPDLVLVHGDTTSALAGALAAYDCGIPIGHVEAGLRSFDFKQPWPEEGYRTVIDALSTLLFAPTEAAARNLRADRRVKGLVHVTGNTGIDALFEARQAVATAPPSPPGALPAKTILVTCHRKENQGAPVRSICTALRRLVEAHPVEIVVPLHPNPLIAREVGRLLADEARIRLIEPLDHKEMVRLIERCWLILTDSGGLQEEGPALGKPVLVLRNVTERGEALACNNLELVGTGVDAITGAVAALLADEAKYERMSRPALPFGDGRAAPRIADAVEAWFEARRRPA
jgi:UDP-N-acetylglucosamine 2-epimerase (non-hydrolysing)